MADCISHGIVPDGRDVSPSLMKALREEGEVRLSEGIYMTGPLSIPSHSRLILEKGAVLRFIPEFGLYEPVFTRWEGVKCWCMHPCLFIDECEDVVIEGEGTIDGSGERWWKECLKKKDDGRNSADEWLLYPIATIGLPLTEAPWLIPLSFVVIRVLDVIKLPPARQLQYLPRGWGIVADDFVSQLYALAANWALFLWLFR